jgi:hypothetical protein
MTRCQLLSIFYRQYLSDFLLTKSGLQIPTSASICLPIHSNPLSSQLWPLHSYHNGRLEIESTCQTHVKNWLCILSCYQIHQFQTLQSRCSTQQPRGQNTKSFSHLNTQPSSKYTHTHTHSVPKISMITVLSIAYTLLLSNKQNSRIS